MIERQVSANDTLEGRWQAQNGDEDVGNPRSNVRQPNGLVCEDCARGPGTSEAASAAPARAAAASTGAAS